SGENGTSVLPLRSSTRRFTAGRRASSCFCPATVRWKSMRRLTRRVRVTSPFASTASTRSSYSIALSPLSATGRGGPSAVAAAGGLGPPRRAPRAAPGDRTPPGTPPPPPPPPPPPNPRRQRRQQHNAHTLTASSDP